MRCRKNVRDLTDEEKQDFVDAVWALKQSGKYDQYVKDHVDAMNRATPAPVEAPNTSVRNAAHRGPGFLPWHREFLRRFEKDLRAEVPGVTLPYWDWSQDAGLADPKTAPIWDDDLMGGDGDPNDNDYVQTGPFRYNPSDPNTWKVANASGTQINDGLRRELGVNISEPATADDITAAQNTVPYDQADWNRSSSPSYRNINEGWLSINGKSPPNLHNRAHVFVGGSMLPGTSPNDPVFFLHHCFVDKMWADWQQQHPGESYVPTASNANAPPGHRLNDAMYPWSTTPADVLNYHDLGYMYDTDPPSVELDTPSLTFNDIPESETTVRAAVFSVSACENVQLEIISGPTVTSGPGNFGTPLGTFTTVTPESGESEGRLWISFTGTDPGDTASGTVTIRCTQTSEEWTIPITANTITPPTTAIDLVLDKSGSMSERSGVKTLGGNDITRMDVLKYAAPIFVNLLDDDDAIGVVSFNEDAQNATGSIDPAGVAPFGTGRANATNAIGGLTPGGWTSIGDGVALAHSRLGPLTGYDTKSTVVLTDGHENQPQYISDVSNLISERVFAIGMGTPEQLQPAALDTLTNGTGGYLVMTDRLDTDDLFRLAKYFLQILAGVKNTDIIVDPEGRLLPGEERRIPFRLTEADIRSDVIVLASAKNVFDLSLETPNGDVIDPRTAAGLSEISHVTAENATYYRMNLPVSVGTQGAYSGKWHAVLSINEDGFRRYLNHIEETDPRGYPVRETHGARYNVNVHTRSDLNLDASLSQNSREPGATLTLRARLTEYDLPVENRATVQADVTRPDTTTTTLTVDEIDPGVFETSFSALQSGVYRCTIRGEGRTLRGRRFTREQLVTGSVWNRGDHPTPLGDGIRDHDKRLCQLLKCLTRDTFAEPLEELGIDVDELRECIQKYCRSAQPPLESTRPDRERRPERREVDFQRLLSDPRIRSALSSITKATQDMESSRNE